MIRMHRFTPPGVALISAVLLAWSAPAGATLGQAPTVSTSVALTPGTTGARKLATKPSTLSSGYLLYESVADNGTTVQEFATPAGVVFAISWSGPVLPDLSSLLGNHFGQFQQHVEQRRKAGLRGSPVVLTSPGLVVQSTGRMRDFAGHAFVPALVPTGVQIENILP